MTVQLFFFYWETGKFTLKVNIKMTIHKADCLASLLSRLTNTKLTIKHTIFIEANYSSKLTNKSSYYSYDFTKQTIQQWLL